LDQWEHQKDKEIRLIIDEKDKKFQIEISQTKTNMNKLIEDSIKDKNVIDKLDHEL
jgi:hypothetical protein